MNCQLFTVGNLEKVLPHKKPELTESFGTALKGEKFSFQIVACADICTYGCKLDVAADVPFDVFEVGLVPARFSYQPDHDDLILGEDLTLFPDVLKPYSGGEIILPANVYVSFWVSFTAEKAGEYKFKIKMGSETNNAFSAETDYTARVYESRPADNDLVITNWVHYDGIADKAGCEPFSAEFYAAAENYVNMAVSHNQTMLYVSMFTPPLDTEVGGERLTVQAVGVKLNCGKYTFDFTEFDKIIALGEKCGVKYYELSHIFSQWGAEFCPKVIAEVDGEKKRIFGWDTSSEGAEYTAFLTAFLPELTKHLDALGITERCWLHLSDEPNASHLERYGRLKNTVKKLAPSLKLMDALSEYEFYEKGYVDYPVVVLSATDEYFKHNANFWVYYCCGPYGNHYSNRFFNMPSLRTRIIGVQMYLTGVKGFLHWGFNFYNSVLSKFKINPYEEPSGGGTFPAGDSFIVYPAENGGCYSSVRLEAFSSGFDDYRALKALEEKIGRDAVVKFLNDSGYPSDFTGYNTDAANFVKTRNEINRLLG